MAVSSGPDIVDSGLVLALDAADRNSFDNTENLLAYSEDFSNAYWAKSNVSITSNAITSPTGSSNASKLVESASTAVHELNRAADPVLSSGIDNYITFSIFAKAAERQYCYIRATGNSKRIAVVVDLSNGTFNVTNWGNTLNSSATVTAYPNGWYRITATAQSNYPGIAPGWFGAFYASPLDSYQLASNVGGGGYSYAGNGTSGIYIWGAHYEFGPGISNYYATTGTIKNRGTTLIDLTDRGNTGTLTNGPTYSSSNGGSLVFDGTNDYVDLTLSPSLQFGTNDFSIEYWIYSISKVSLYPSLFTNYNGWGSGAIFLGIDHSSYPNKYSFWINGQGSGASTNTNITYNKWEHLVAVRDGGICKLYLNGIQDGTTINGTGITLNGNNSSLARIGAIQGESQFYNGRIANAKIYNRALSATEIQQNFNSVRSRFGI
jgi:hypothetical protein